METARQKLRRLIRSVVKNPAILRKIEQQRQLEKEEEVLQSQQESFFDPSIYKRKLQPHTGWLSIEARRVLSKEPHDRTKDDIDSVEDEFAGMAFFQRFPYTIRRELTRCMRFFTFRKGQIILKIGHHACAMYVIMAGTVAILLPGVDETTGEVVQNEETLLVHGDHFGSTALILGQRRTLSAVCKGLTQVLQLDEEDFNRLIKGEMTQEYSLRHQTLNEIPVIKDFPYEESAVNKELFTFHCRVEKYKKNTLILGATTELPNYMYLVALGECKLEQDIDYVIECGLGYKRLRPPPDTAEGKSEQYTTCNHDSNPRIYRKRVEICLLRSGNYFGVGEDLSKSYITAIDTVECVLVPRFLLAKAGQRYLEKMKMQLEECYPTVQQVLDRYLELTNWNRFKRKVIQEVMKKYPPKCSFGPKKGGRPLFNKYF